MRDIRRIRTLLILSGFISGAAAMTSAQVSIGPQGVYRVDGAQEGVLPNRKTYQIVVTPAPEPDPPLKYALYPRSYECQSGNSVPYWYRAMFEFGREEEFGEFNENMKLWLDGPINDLPVEQVSAFLSRFGSGLEDAQIAAMRAQTDWDLGLYDLRGTDTIYFLLPEFQEARTLARLMTLQARLSVAKGNYEDALTWFRANFRLAHDVAQPETVINQLIGTAIVSIACDDLLDLVAAPGSPNLYWALAAIPRPPVDYRTSYEYEQTLAERYVPWLADSDDPTRTAAEWRTLFRETVRDLAHESDLAGLSIGDDTADWQVALATCALISRNYPRVKRDLIAWGHPAEVVEQMPVGEATALHQRAVYKYVSQRVAKWTLLPYRAVGGRDQREQQRLEEQGWLAPAWSGRETFPIVTTLMPPFEMAHQAEARGTTRPIALMVLEAIRMHAWQNGGRLPASLDEITVVPVPRNPATGAAFPYRLDGDTATLDVATTPNPDDASWYWRVEMRIDPNWTPPNEK